MFLPISFSNSYFKFHREILNFVPEIYILLDVVILILNIIMHVCTAIAIQQPVWILIIPILDCSGLTWVVDTHRDRAAKVSRNIYDK